MVVHPEAPSSARSSPGYPRRPADLGTISIEWDKVDRISTTTILEVQLTTGQTF
jgi:hypothetical protein